MLLLLLFIYCVISQCCSLCQDGKLYIQTTAAAWSGESLHPSWYRHSYESGPDIWSPLLRWFGVGKTHTQKNGLHLLIQKTTPLKSKQAILSCSYNWQSRSQSTKVPKSENVNDEKQTGLPVDRGSLSFLSSPACQHNLIWVGSQPACPHSSPDPGKTVGKPISCSSQPQQPRPEIETHRWMLTMHWKISSVLTKSGGRHLPQGSFHCSRASVCFDQAKVPDVHMHSGFCLWQAGNY